MAWAPDPTVRITLYFRDDDGASSTHVMNVAAGALPVAGAFAAAYAALFVPLTSCALYRATVSLRYLDDTDPTAPAGTDVNRRSVFLFRTADDGRYVLSIPGPVEALLAQPPNSYASVAINTADPAIAALISAMTTGVGGTAPCAPWTDGGSWGDGGGGGGSWGDGGGGGGSWGWGSGGGGGGSWGGGGGSFGDDDYNWLGVDIAELLTAYWGYERDWKR